jgi:isoleucyl-tRNA synthetase
VVAAPLAAPLGEKLKKTFDVVATVKGADLVGRSYLPPFDTFRAAGPPPTARLADGEPAPVAWRVVAADFVTTDSGTGVVHVAPAFGEVDYGVLVAEPARSCSMPSPRTARSPTPSLPAAAGS